MERTDTIIIGGSQAGLAVSYHLTQQGRDHMILEKDQVASAWRNGRWDSFTLVTPNWTLRLPGYHYAGDNPDGFLPRQEVVQYLENYAALFNPPLQLGVEAAKVEANSGPYPFLIQTSAGPFEAKNVIIAAGTFQKPRIPAFSSNLPSHIHQIPSGAYRNPQELPPGAVLVVGGAQSGCQITDELNRAGRTVYLNTSRSPRLPRRYRGQDIFIWADQLGLLNRTVDKLESPKDRFAANPQISGVDGGRSLNLHKFAAEGVNLLGRALGAHGNRLLVAPDLHENLAKADQFEAEILKEIDKYILNAGIQAPEHTEPPLDSGYKTELLTGLDLDAAGIKTVIWACGYTFDFSWIDFPIRDDFGYPVQSRGVTNLPGLYFVGLNYLYSAKSALFLGVGEDAAHIAAHLASQ